uniref:Uncharacterized protein n=1 Tax=Arundo donax TaxID=35708 RepID=A0A0A9AVM7_ARUDO
MSSISAHFMRKLLSPFQHLQNGCQETSTISVNHIISHPQNCLQEIKYIRHRT